MLEGDSENNNPKLHEVSPRENSGRDTIARYHAQFRAAANECLSLLEDKGVDRVYCDYQDDFVTRLNIDGNIIYNFYQVKTKAKRNHQWSINEIFGLYKKKKEAIPKNILESFAGKLLIHTLKFKNSCGQVIFLTNVHFDDDVENCANAILSEDDSNPHYSQILAKFNETFTPTVPLEKLEIQDLVKKLTLQPAISHLSPDDGSFSAIARDTIFKYSEIDLQHSECDEIINNLVALVEKKSFSKLVSDVSESDLDGIAGVGLSDMLEILSISKGAYKQLKDGGDPQAIRNASIIHRIMDQAGMGESMIRFVTGCKVNWDCWLRDKRHTISEFDLNFLLQRIDKLATEWIKKEDPFNYLEAQLQLLFEAVQNKGISNTLNKDLLLGAVFSSMVRGETQ